MRSSDDGNIAERSQLTTLLAACCGALLCFDLGACLF